MELTCTIRSERPQNTSEVNNNIFLVEEKALLIIRTQVKSTLEEELMTKSKLLATVTNKGAKLLCRETSKKKKPAGSKNKVIWADGTKLNLCKNYVKRRFEK